MAEKRRIMDMDTHDSNGMKVRNGGKIFFLFQ